MPAVKSILTAGDAMVAEPVCVPPSMTIRELARIFDENEISGAPVVDAEGRVIGVVSKSDLIHRCTEGTISIPPAYLFEVLSEQSGEEQEFGPEPLVYVEDFMTEEPVVVRPNLSAAKVARLMADNRIHRVIVVDAEKFPLGIITTLDLLKVFPQ
jgi:CBS domain-containing protein